MERFPRPYQSRDCLLEPDNNFYGLVARFLLFKSELSRNLDIVLFTLAGSSLIIAGSCVINNYYDRDIDQLMQRTRTRPTVTGKIQPSQALWFGILLTALGFIMLLMTNLTTAAVGFVGVFTYVFLYTMWSKRRYTVNTIIGSVSGLFLL